MHACSSYALAMPAQSKNYGFFAADNKEAHSERSPVWEEELGHRQVLVPTMLSAAEWSGHRKSKCSITL